MQLLGLYSARLSPCGAAGPAAAGGAGDVDGLPVGAEVGLAVGAAVGTTVGITAGTTAGPEFPGPKPLGPVDATTVGLFDGVVSKAKLLRENGTTPARRAMSCSPSCQCIASTARHGISISCATLAHISALNLFSRRQRLSTNQNSRDEMDEMDYSPLVQACKPILTVFIPL